MLSDVQSARANCSVCTRDACADVEEALIRSRTAGRDVSLFFKCENFQKTGSSEIRGATNAVFSLKMKKQVMAYVHTQVETMLKL